MTPDDVRSQVTDAWAEAEADIGIKTPEELLALAPGEEILDLAFMKFAGRHYRKRDDGPSIARMCGRPTEIAELLESFLAD